MRGALAIFTKTPELTPVKTRLARDVGEEVARNFFSWSVRQVANTASQAANAKGNLDILWAIAEKDGVTHERWENSSFTKIWSGEGCLGTQMNYISNKLLDEGYDYVLLTGTDIPDLTPSLILQAAKYLESTSEACAIGPCGDGGFYLYGSNRKSEKMPWVCNDYKAPDSWQKLTSDLGFENMTILPSLVDVDEASDLEKIKGAI